VLQKQVY